MSQANECTWELQPCGELVRIAMPGGESRVVPLAAATALWLAGRPTSASGSVVLLSFATPGINGCARMNVVVTESDMGPPVPWPRWHPHPAPAWRRCAVGEWLSLPSLQQGEPAYDVVVKHGREQAAKEGVIDRAIGDRCREIVQHGEREDFRDTLDYYTTLRVKHAYLLMNAEGLRERLREVRNRVETVRRVLLSAPPELAAQWKVPDTSSGAVLEEDTGRAPDPNVLCVPQAGDYVLEGLSSTDGLPADTGDA